ncbi:MAG: aminopeptidase N, partial [Planctomycetota bacterium]
WRAVLLDLGKVFWHKTVDTDEFEARMSEVAGFDYSRVFDQYLRDTRIPELQYSTDGDRVDLWWDKVVPGFEVPVVVVLNGEPQRLLISSTPTSVQLGGKLESIELDRNFYMTVAESASSTN